MKKCTPEARQPGHKQASETQPALIFLKRAVSKCGLLKGMSERERVQGKQVYKGKKNTNSLDNHPQGSLTKQQRLLQGKGIFTENKEGMQPLLERLERSTDCAGKVENAASHVLLKQN